VTDLFVTVDGPEDAPPLVLLHGTGASGRSWSTLVPLLTPAHRVIRVDLPGCGSSAAPDGGDYDMPSQARLVGAALDRVGVTSAVVAGHSSGGAVATALAAARPGLVRGLVLIDTGPDMAAYIAPDLPLRSDPTEDDLRRALAQAFRPGFAVPRR
jgi:pimeloyl-ACP methyl ester carboxylesterase